MGEISVPTTVRGVLGRLDKSPMAQMLVKVLLYVAASPFIGAAAMLGFVVLICVLGWAIYGIAAWLWLFLEVAHLFVSFPLYSGKPPMNVLLPAMASAFACHTGSLWWVLEKVKLPSETRM